jgi:glycosyltransferase involved in cell wall biosynthesis
MTALPLITIVTPSFNQAQFLEKTIRSVLDQDYPYVEYIVIDGGSTDGSVDIIKKYEKNIAYWVSEPDTGQSNAINKGFAKATGVIFAWINSDDLISPSAVTLAVHHLLSNPAIGAVYGDRLHIDAKDNVVGIRRLPSHDSAMFRRNFTLPQETVFFRREIFEHVGGLDERLHFAMDFDLWCKMNRVTHMRHIPAFMGYFREHDTAKSVVVNRSKESESLKYQREHEEVYRSHFGASLPSPAKMHWYRFRRRLSLLIEQRSDAHRQEVLNIRCLISQ